MLAEIPLEMVCISNESAVMAQADVNIRFPAVDVNMRRLKLSIFSCSLNFYMMEIKGKVFG